jgi:L-threonylcarbamoyladenylate synthase
MFFGFNLPFCLVPIFITGNLNEAAKNLYAAMHRLDHSNLDIIVAERLPDAGLGKTINDKLERASKNE